MAEDVNHLLAAMSLDGRNRVEREVERIRSTPLYQLRKALALTQEQVAQELGVGQAAVSRLERRPDMYLSTLRRFVEAMGGELEIRARFPSGEVIIEDLGMLMSEDAAAGELQHAS
jgi:transcriptional regulator with XRE-family HTH domain